MGVNGLFQLSFTVLLQRVLSLFRRNCARWLSKVASAIRTHLPETKSITYLVILGIGEKAEAWAREKWLVFCAVHAVYVNARKPCKVGTVFQRGWCWLFSALDPRGFLVDGRHGSGVVSLAVGL